jgi:hypothetical protein
MANTASFEIGVELDQGSRVGLLERLVWEHQISERGVDGHEQGPDAVGTLGLSADGCETFWSEPFLARDVLENDIEFPRDLHDAFLVEVSNVSNRTVFPDLNCSSAEWEKPGGGATADPISFKSKSGLGVAGVDEAAVLSTSMNACE